MATESELMLLVGQRMRAAAMAKGLQQQEVAEMIDRSKGTISRWWSGQQRPDLEDMEAYAEAVGVDSAWLWTGRETLTPNLLMDTVSECLLRVMHGEAPSAAFDGMTKQPWWLTPEQRRTVDAAAERLREFVRSEVPEWQSLSDFEQRAAMERLLSRSR